MTASRQLRETLADLATLEAAGLSVDGAMHSPEHDWPFLQCPSCGAAVLVLAISGQMQAHGYGRKVCGDDIEVSADAPCRCTKCAWMGDYTAAQVRGVVDEGAGTPSE